MQVADPVEIVDLAGRVDVVLRGAAVLGDVQRQARRRVGDLDQQLIQAIRVDQPSYPPVNIVTKRQLSIRFHSQYFSYFGVRLK